MKKYHVYGLGNALVDFDYEAEVTDLTQLNIDKGVMTLIDEHRHHQLIAALQEHKHIKACGGSAANTMIAIMQLGGKGFYSCKVAADKSGDFYLQDLQNHGLHTNLTHQNRQQGHTGKCIVLVTPDADRTMNTYLGITASFSTDELVEEAIKDSQYIYIEGYLVASPTGCIAAKTAREIAEHYGTKTSITLSDPNMTEYFGDGLRNIIGNGVDLLFCNEDEAKLFSQTKNLTDAYQYLKTMAKTLVITRGSQGSLIFDGSNTIEIKPYPVKAIDTVGAGDMYAGAFLYGLTHGYSYAEAGDIASCASAKVVAKFGPRLNKDEVALLLKHTQFKKAVSV